MKHILTTLLISVTLVSSGQTVAFSRQVVSSFERDGKIWISYDSKNAPVQDFTPIDEIYQCHGEFMKIIVDTIRIKNAYRLSFSDGKWAEIKIEYPKEYSETEGYSYFADHIMFHVMSACFDKQFVYCQCTKKFKIVNKNF